MLKICVRVVFQCKLCYDMPKGLVQVILYLQLKDKYTFSPLGPQMVLIFNSSICNSLQPKSAGSFFVGRLSRRQTDRQTDKTDRQTYGRISPQPGPLGPIRVKRRPQCASGGPIPAADATGGAYRTEGVGVLPPPVKYCRNQPRSGQRVHSCRKLRSSSSSRCC